MLNIGYISDIYWAEFFNFKLNSFVVEQVLQFHARTTISSVKTVCSINMSIFNMMSMAWIEYFWECIFTHIP
jgi:hypothetical protein